MNTLENHMNPEAPLIVRYETRALPPAIGRWQIRAITRQGLDALRKRIPTGDIVEVVLVGPSVATGWRLGTERAVKFVERPTMSAHDAICQNQASMRIVHLEPQQVQQ